MRIPTQAEADTVIRWIGSDSCVADRCPLCGNKLRVESHSDSCPISIARAIVDNNDFWNVVDRIKYFSQLLELGGLTQMYDYGSEEMPDDIWNIINRFKE